MSRDLGRCGWRLQIVAQEVGREPPGFRLVFTRRDRNPVLDGSSEECWMKGVLAVVLGTMGYIMIGVALAGMG